jgi:cell wall-associated NlpC family hydrolase
MGAAAKKRGIPPELPIMAALTESGMRNLNYGDADSVGFFQMRVSIWNSGPYAGYGKNPDRQLDWFLDQAEAVKKQRVASGLPIDSKHYGDWIADIERPAAQYRGRYQPHLQEARDLLDSAGPKSGSDGADQVVNAAPDDTPNAGKRAVAAVAEAKKYLGTPYKWGGSSPSTGFDCSGLVQYVYAKEGISLPRVTDQQILAPGGQHISRKDLLPGDLVFFRDSTGYVHHVGISLGGDKFINAPHTGANVRINSLKEPYFAKEFTGGRRFVKAVDAAPRAGVAAGVAEASVKDSEPDPEAVRIAQAALERDAAEAQQPGSMLFRAIERQEANKGNEVQMFPAVGRSAPAG